MTEPSDIAPSPAPPSPPPAPAAPSRQPLFLLAALILLVLATYWPVLTFDLTTWDDGIHLTNNPLMHPPRLSGVARYWTAPYFGLYIPVAYTVWTFVGIGAYRPGPAGGSLDPAVFHAANLLLHIGCTVLVYLILRRLLRHAWPAALAAALFAVHPVQVETVAWASAFRDLLAVFLSLLAIERYLAFLHRSRPPPYVIAVIAFVGAILSKPTAIVVPLMMAALGRLDGRSWKLLLPTTWPLLALSLACAVWTKLAQPGQFLATTPLWSRPLVAADAVAFYLGKLLWPARLGIDYGRTPQYIFQTGQAWWTWVFPAALIIAAVIAARRQSVWLVCLLIFVIGLLPVLGFVPFDFQDKSTVADHYLYLPMLGVALSVAAGLLWIDRPAGYAVAVILVLLAAGRSWRQTWTWRNSSTLFRHAIEVNPGSSSAWTNLAYLAPSPSEAEQLARHALKLKPTNYEAMVNLGAALGMQQRFGEAIHCFEAALRMNPKDPVAARMLPRLREALSMERDAAAATTRSLP